MVYNKNLMISQNAINFRHITSIKGAFCDLVWSDPDDRVEAWAVSPRGAGWLFGSKVTNDFMQRNNLKLICRAHQLVHEGNRYNTFCFNGKI